ncbi:MAG: hypothetical protein WAW15_02080 [Minisyncoccales bacterium]
MNRIFPKVRKILFKTEESREEVREIAEKLQQLGKMGLIKDHVFTDIDKKMAASIELKKHILSYENGKITIDVAKEMEKAMNEDDQITEDIMLGVKFIGLSVEKMVKVQ